jgi:ATP-binding cassette subfamily B protein
MSIEVCGVDVVFAGRKVLDDVTLSINSGEHVGIIGVSGAGKSTLVSLLLGWATPQRGRIEIDGNPLTAECQQLINGCSVWLDPAVHLWDQSLLDNLTFGSRHSSVPLFDALSGASLLDVLPTLPNGLQSELGESGVRLSGGQGQRVRLGRSLLRDAPRLVLMDEPFRGLEREQRQALLDNCRQRWRKATLLMVTHDVEDTLGFDKIVIIDQGRVVESGEPSVLSADVNSRYARALAQARQVYAERWGAHTWKRLRMQGGRLVDTATGAAS